jgi:hypothetical protein
MTSVKVCLLCDNPVCWQENSGLIIELNNLRQELKDARKHIRDMESILGISSKCMNAKEAKAKLQMAVQNHEDIHTEYKSKLEVGLSECRLLDCVTTGNFYLSLHGAGNIKLVAVTHMIMIKLCLPSVKTLFNRCAQPFTKLVFCMVYSN